MVVIKNIYGLIQEIKELPDDIQEDAVEILIEDREDDLLEEDDFWMEVILSNYDELLEVGFITEVEE